MVKNPPASAGDIRDVGSIPGQEDPLEEGTATHSSILDRESMDRGAWWSTIHRVTKSRTLLKQLSMHEGISSKSANVLMNDLGHTIKILVLFLQFD